MARGESDVVDWLDGGIVEYEVKCGKCGRDIACFSAFVTLEGDGFASEIELGRDLDHREIRTARSFPSAADQAERNASAAHNWRWTLVCAGRRCGFRRVVIAHPTVERAMVNAWRRRSHTLVAGVDL